MIGHIRVIFVEYLDTTGVTLYWKSYQPFVIHRAHHILFEYNARLSIEDRHTTGSLLLRQDSKVRIHNSDLLKFITCERDLTSNTLSDTKIITY